MFRATSIKNRDEGNNGRESNDEIKEEFSKSLIDGELNLSSDELKFVKNCKETTTFVKKCEKIIECKKRGIFNLAYKQGILI